LSAYNSALRKYRNPIYTIRGAPLRRTRELLRHGHSQNSRVSGNQPVTVSFDVTNTGNRAAADVAEVYVGEATPPVPRPLRELKGFTKVLLNPGETKHVSAELNRRAFAYYNVGKHEWTADPGKFQIYVGDFSQQMELNRNLVRQ